jgi:flagellar basal-body rod protein FlgF
MMTSGVYVALSGAKLQELRLEITANNLANANTTGFKADKVTSRSFEFELENAFDDFEQIKPTDMPLDTPYNIAYAKTNIVGTNFSQGPSQQTGNPLNIALEGPGFIAVDTPNGVRYTRQGSFQLTSKEELVTPDGNKVRGKGLSDLGTGEITIDTDGNVLIDGITKGSLEIVEFAAPDALQKEGNALFVSPDTGAAKKSTETKVKQGYLEMPNVNPVTEMVNLIELNRLYEAYQKTITSIDESTEKLINGVGGNL